MATYDQEENMIWNWHMLHEKLRDIFTYITLVQADKTLHIKCQGTSDFWQWVELVEGRGGNCLTTNHPPGENEANHETVIEYNNMNTINSWRNKYQYK